MNATISPVQATGDWSIKGRDADQVFASSQMSGTYLDSLDENQRMYAERLMVTLLIQNPDADQDELARYVAGETLATVPTFKEAVRAISNMRADPCYCYLAFYGIGNTAQFLKIGMTKHPEQRLYGISTGNPLDCLWVYTAPFAGRHNAFGAEQTMLRHQSFRKRRGEWVNLDSCSEESSRELADHLGIVANGADFTMLTYRDGRAAS